MEQGRSEWENNTIHVNTPPPHALILSFSQVWLHVAVTTELERLNSEDYCEFKSSLYYTVNARSAYTTEGTLASKNKGK